MIKLSSFICFFSFSLFGYTQCFKKLDKYDSIIYIESLNKYHLKSFLATGEILKESYFSCDSIRLINDTNFVYNYIDSIYVEYYKNKQKKEETKNANNKVMVTTWYENGNIESKYSLTKGVLDGEYEEFYPSGILQNKYIYERRFKLRLFKKTTGHLRVKNCQGETVRFKKSKYYSVKVGIWKYWNENGSLIKEEIYKNGHLRKTINH